MFWAEIVDGKVVRVTVSDGAGFGAEWLTKTLGGLWMGCVGGVSIGYSYDDTRDAFIPPTPYPSWVLDEATCLWVAPIAYPAEGTHTWDEEAGDWVEVTNENS